MSRHVVFAGLPHTGKSTYLGLIGLAITQKKLAGVELDGFADDRSYVNGLAEALFKCEEPDRTEVGQQKGLVLSLKFTGGEQTVLEVPDVSGEVWKELLLERSWTPGLRAQVESCAGVCVFVHVGDFAQDPTLAETGQIAAALEVADIDDEGQNLGFARDLVNGQIDLVDLVQIVGEQFAPANRPISVILSAFDSVTSASPAEWIAGNAPLLDQFLTVNASALQAQIFGLSAQGGSYESERDRLKASHPADRAFLVTSDGHHTSLDAPIRWAMGLE